MQTSNTNLHKLTPMETKKSPNTTATIGDSFCKDCGWPVVHACCNDEFTTFKDAANWDWWTYCSNKGCKNHDGEGIFQAEPEWIAK